MDDLTKLIDQIVEDKTFSLEAVKIIEELRATAISLEEEVSQINKTYIAEQATSKELRKKNDLLTARVMKISDREKAVEAREAKITELEKAKAVAQAQASTYQSCMELVFRNTVVRREMLGSVPIIDSSGYHTQQTSSETTTEVAE